MTPKPTYQNLEKRVAELEQQVQQYQTEKLINPPETLSVFMEAFRHIPLCKTFEDAAKYIFKQCKRLTGARSGYVALLSDDGEENEVLFLDAGGMSCDVDPDLPMPIRGLREVAYKTKDVVYDNAFAESPWVKYMPDGHVKLNNVLFAPLNIENKTLGIIGIANKPNGFNKKDVHLAKILGDLAAVALIYANSQDSLRESEERFRKLFNNASEGILVAEIKSKKFHFANPAICKMLGYLEDELIGMNVTDIHPEKSLDQVISEFEAQARGEKELAPSIPCRQKDGQIIYADINTRRANIKGIEYNIGLFTDITERKQAEEALLASEEKYRSMMEAMKNDAYICSPDFRIEYMNPRMVSRVGRDATGEYCYKAIYDFDEKCSWCVFDQILQGEHIDYEVADPRNGRYYSVTNSPIYHSFGRISKLSIFLDITDKKAVEALLHQARKMESIGTMAGGIAHDFNNLLYMITGNAELAMEDIPEWNPVHKNLKEIKAAGLRAAGIVKQLLNFSHQVDQKFRPIGAVTVIKDAIKFLRSTIPTTIEIQKDFPDKDVTIIGDPVQINQVMMNLCINAAQAMEETGGLLDISLENISLGVDAMGLYPDLTPGDFLKISVRDTGPGMGPEIIGKIFDPYFTTKEVGKGSGLGLAVVHGIVKNHNGAITVDSKTGKGAIFTILFPVVDEKPVIKAKNSEIISKGSGETILFIDDEVSIVKMTERMLKRLGYEVETKTSPLEALERFQSKPNRFDLVITDMTMPQMTGVKLAEKLKDMRFDIPILICTGYSPLMDEEKAQSVGISGYVKKPVVRRNIARIIRKVLDEAKESAHA